MVSLEQVRRLWLTPAKAALIHPKMRLVGKGKERERKRERERE